jgi:hypothetical protein
MDRTIRSVARGGAVALTPQGGVSTMGKQENADPALRGRRYKARWGGQRRSSRLAVRPSVQAVVHGSGAG